MQRLEGPVAVHELHRLQSVTIGAGYEQPPLHLREQWGGPLLKCRHHRIEIRGGFLIRKGILNPWELSQIHNREPDLRCTARSPCALLPLAEGVGLHVICPILGVRIGHLEPLLVVQEDLEELRCGRRYLRTGLVLQLQLLCLSEVGLSGPLQEHVH